MKIKKISTIFSLTLTMLGFSTISFAQETSAPAEISANIITPISVTKMVDMNFGNIAVQSSNGGTVVLSTAGARTESGGVTLPAVTGTVSAAKFEVNGEGSSTYSITLPSSPITITNGVNSMSVDAFTSNPSGTGALTAGTQDINVGATLNINAAQPAGLYTNSTDLVIIVNYN